MDDVLAQRAADEFVRAHARFGVPPFVPELRLLLAEDAIELWERTEDEVGESNLPPPFWGFAWAGGQALARYLLDNPDLVRGRRVLDIASGGGVVAIAAAKAGAASVTASEIDRFAVAAIALNADANGVIVNAVFEDVLTGDPGDDVDVVLAGDVFYSREMAGRVQAFVRRAVDRGALVLVGDPGRAYRPGTGFRVVATYDVPVPRALEDADTKATTVLRAC